MVQAFEDVMGELPSLLGSDTPDDLPGAINWAAQSLGIDPLDLATVMSYETGGTFDPWQKGPTTKWGQHRGLLQWGEPQRKEFNVFQGQPIGQRAQAWVNYLKRAGVTPGTGLLDIYSAVNAGRVGRHGASDRPGYTVSKHVAGMEPHREKARGLLSGYVQPQESPVVAETPVVEGAPPATDFDDVMSELPSVSGVAQPTQQSALPMPQMQPIRAGFGYL